MNNLGWTRRRLQTTAKDGKNLCHLVEGLLAAKWMLLFLLLFTIQIHMGIHLHCSDFGGNYTNSQVVKLLSVITQPS